MKVKHIIPGHGPLSSNKDIEDLKTYLTIFDKVATELAAEEKDVEKLASEIQKVVPERSSGDFIIQMNLKSRYLIDDRKDQGKY